MSVARTHHVQADAAAAVSWLLEAVTVVVHLEQQETVAPIEADADLGRRSMFERIVHRLLRDAINMSGDRFVRHMHGLWLFEDAAHRTATGGVLRQGGQGHRQSVFRECYRRETAKARGSSNCLAQLPTDFGTGPRHRASFQRGDCGVVSSTGGSRWPMPACRSLPMRRRRSRNFQHPRRAAVAHFHVPHFAAISEMRRQLPLRRSAGILKVGLIVAKCPHASQPAIRAARPSAARPIDKLSRPSGDASHRAAQCTPARP